MRPKKLPAEVYTPEEIGKLIKACSTRAKTGIRNRALIVILYRGGLRISEALQLQPKDLDRSAGTVRILHGKGDKSRTIGLDDGAFAVIERWLDVRGNLGIGARSPVFCTLKGEPIDTRQIRALFKRLGKLCGIEKRVHPHGMRHTLAFELANEGVDIPTISAQLGHSNISVTHTYLKHLAPQTVIDAMKARRYEPEA